MATYEIRILSTGGRTLYAMPTNVALSTYSTNRVLLEDEDAGDAGNYAAEVEDPTAETYAIFEGATTPANWGAALATWAKGVSLEYLTGLPVNTPSGSSVDLLKNAVAVAFSGAVGISSASIESGEKITRAVGETVTQTIYVRDRRTNNPVDVSGKTLRLLAHSEPTPTAATVAWSVNTTDIGGDDNNAVNFALTPTELSEHFDGWYTVREPGGQVYGWGKFKVLNLPTEAS